MNEPTTAAIAVADSSNMTQQLQLRKDVRRPTDPPAAMEVNPGLSSSFTKNRLVALFTDGLHLIFSYLNNQDWTRSMNTCHHWSTTGASSPPRHLLFEYGKSRATVFPPIRLASHFTRAQLWIQDWTAAEMRTLLLTQLPYLTEMKLSILLKGVSDLPIAFPLRLKSLTVSLFGFDMPQLLCPITGAAATLTSLTLDGLSLPYPFNDEFGRMLMSLTHLTQLTLDTTFFLYRHAEPEFECDFITACKLTHLSPELTSLNLFRGPYCIMRSLHLLSPIPSLTEMNLSSPVNFPPAPDVTSDFLLRLHRFAPNLTRLSPYFLDYSDFTNHLPLFKHLQTYEVSPYYYIPLPFASFIPTFSQCPSISSIIMSAWTLESPSDWSAFALSLPQLQRLTLQVAVLHGKDIELISAGVQLFPHLRSFTMDSALYSDGDIYSDETELFKELFQDVSLFPQLTHLVIGSEEHGAFEYDWERGINLSFRSASTHHRTTAAAQQHAHFRSLGQPIVQSSKDVPSERLVGIETNPGPIVTTTTPTTPTAQTLLYGVLSTFSCFSLSDVIPAYHSCHYWYECGLREKSTQVELLPFSGQHDRIGSEDFLSIFNSPLGYHVTSLSTVSIRQVFIMHDRAPQLGLIKQLSVHFTPNNSTLASYGSNHTSCSMVTLPSAFTSLTSISLHITADLNRMDASLNQSFINSMPKSGTPITQFKFENQFSHHFFFSTLRRPTLTQLELISPHGLVTCEDQSIFASLPLRRLVCRCRGLESLDLMIYHPQSPLMMNIEELEWSEWNPTDSDWDHLAQYPPPRLHTLTLQIGQLLEFSRLSILQPTLTSIIIGQVPPYIPFELDDMWIKSSSQCQSLKQLTCDPLVFKDEQLCQLLIAFNLNQLEQAGDSYRQFFQARDHLPPFSIFHSFKWSDLCTLLSHVSHVNRCSTIRIHGLISGKTDFPIDSFPTTRDHFHHQLRRLCEEHARTMTETLQLEIKRVGSMSINFTYHHAGRPKEPPQPQLIGIEPNPGPFSTTQLVMAAPNPTSSDRSHNELLPLVPSAQTLFVDGLLSIYQFLTLAELIPALHTCHYWYECGLKERSRQRKFDFDFCFDHTCINLIASPLRYHVTSVIGFLWKAITSHQLQRLTHIQLIRISLHPDDAESYGPLPSSTHIFPSSLTTLNITIHQLRIAAIDLCQSLLNRLPSDASQLVELEIICPFSDYSSGGDTELLSHFDFSPLLQLPSLQSWKFPRINGWTRANQLVCSQLPLTKMILPSGSRWRHCINRPDWTIFHAESPFMNSIQEWQWDDWIPTEIDWLHLTHHPPPQLHSLSMRYDASQPMSSIDLAALQLRTLSIFTYFDYAKRHQPSGYGPILKSLTSLTSLTLDDSQLKDEELCEILEALTQFQLDELHILSSSTKLDQSFKYLPRRSTIRSLTLQTLQLFPLYLSLANRLKILHIDFINVSDPNFLPPSQSMLDTFCRQDCTSIQQVTIDLINDHAVKFKYDQRSNTHPPAPRLIGVELNPGPSTDGTRLTSTTDPHLTRPHQLCASTLFTDGLLTIYSYLTNQEFFQVLHVSRHWSHCCSTGPSRQMEYYYTWVKDSSEHITRESRLNYHFTRLEPPQKSPARLFMSELIQLLLLLPYLTTIDVVIMKRSSDVSNTDFIRWPQRLRSLACSFEGRDYPRLFHSICQLSSLTSLSFESLGSRCVGFNPSDSFRPLTHLTTLKIRQRDPENDPLQFTTSYDIFFPPNLTDLTIYSHHFLDHLSPMHNLQQVRKLHLVYLDLRPNDLRLIHSAMPDLELLDGVHFCHDAIDISLFNRLESIDLQFPLYDFTTASIHPLIDAMGQLSRVTHLRLEPNYFPTEEYWTHAHRSLVHLTSLQIESFKAESRPLTHLGLFANRLKRLTIITIVISLSDLEIISTLDQLEYLSLSSVHTRSADLTPEMQVNELKRYFHSTDILPHLQELYLKCASIEFVWNQLKSINIWTYRLKSQGNHQLSDASVVPPAQPLVGIESNPGPIAQFSPQPESTAQTLFVDGVLSIFSWLKLSELLPALHSCHYWNACGLKDRCRQYRFELSHDNAKRSQQFLNLMDSPLNFHVTELLNIYIEQFLSVQRFELPNLDMFEVAFMFNPSQPYQLSPQLTFPKRLTRMKIYVFDEYSAYDLCQSFIHLILIGTNITYLEFMHMMTSSVLRYDLSPLQQLSSLTELELIQMEGSNALDLVSCANLPLTKITFSGFLSLDLTVFHPQSKFMLNIQEMNFDEWLPSQHEWLHLSIHPPPKLHTLTLSVDVAKPIHGLANLHLSNLRMEKDSNYDMSPVTYPEPQGAYIINILTTLSESLELLELWAFRWTDDELCQILIALKQLKHFEFLQNQPLLLITAAPYLPHYSKFTRLTFHSWEAMSDQLAQATHLEELVIEELEVNEAGFSLFWDPYPFLDQLCSNMTNQFTRIQIDSINDEKVKFKYVKPSQLVQPPAKRLVGVELNPGPNSITQLDTNLVNDSSSYGTQVTTIVPGRLLKDMIHLIDSYLNHHDWMTSLQVNQHWLSCGGSSPSRHIAYPLNDDGVVAHLPPPRLLHHFTSIKRHRQLFQTRPVGLTSTLLQQLSQQLPHLTSIACDLQRRYPVNDIEVVWSVRLRTLDINLQKFVHTNLISSIFKCHTLTKLNIFGISYLQDMSIFHSLNQLIHLESLTMDINQWSLNDVDLLSAMGLTHLPPHLIYLNFCYGRQRFFSLYTLSRMSPLALELEEIVLSGRTIESGALELLYQFAPNLTQLMLHCCHPSNFVTLQQFQSLQRVEIDSESPTATDLTTYESSVVSGLVATRQLTSLYFNRWVPSSLESWLQLSHGLIHLSSIELLDANHLLPSLDVFTRFPSLTSCVFTVQPLETLEAIINFFQPSNVMPNLQRLVVRLFVRNSVPAFEWWAGQTRNDQYRSKPVLPPTADIAHVHPPDAPLVGIEPNPSQSSEVLHCTEPMSPAAVQPAVSRLYRDVLHIIFNYLDLHEFVLASIVNKSWLLAGQTMRPRNDELKYRGRVDSLTQSKLRVHINRLKIDINFRDQLEPTGLYLLSERMNHLLQLNLSIRVIPYYINYLEPLKSIHSHLLPLPPHLHQLLICFDFTDVSHVVIRKLRHYLSRCMSDLADQSTTLVKLKVRLENIYISRDMACLPELRTLSNVTDLTLPHQFDTQRQLELVKFIPSIRVWHSPDRRLNHEAIQHLIEGSTSDIHHQR